MRVDRDFAGYHEGTVKAHAKLANEIFGRRFAFLDGFQKLLGAAVGNGAEIFDELDVSQINEVLAKNVPMETLQFFASYAKDFGESQDIRGDSLKRLPNLLLLGYLLRIVEERLISEGETLDPAVLASPSA